MLFQSIKNFVFTLENALIKFSSGIKPLSLFAQKNLIYFSIWKGEKIILYITIALKKDTA